VIAKKTFHQLKGSFSARSSQVVHPVIFLPSCIQLAQRLAQLHIEQSPEAAFIWAVIGYIARMESVHDADNVAIRESQAMYLISLTGPFPRKGEAVLTMDSPAREKNLRLFCLYHGEECVIRKLRFVG